MLEEVDELDEGVDKTEEEVEEVVDADDEEDALIISETARTREGSCAGEASELVSVGEEDNLGELVPDRRGERVAIITRGDATRAR